MIPAFTSLGSGPTVLMLHGIGGGHRAFARQVETFASAGYRAVAWDMPGYGGSALIEPYTFNGLAHSCAMLIEALMQADGGGPVILLGHSMGGMVAQELIATRPELVSRLILCGTSAAFGRKPGGEVSEVWQKEFISQRTAPLDAGKTMADMAQILVPQMIGPGAVPEGVQLATGVMAGVSPATYRRALEALVTFDRGFNLSNITVPTLLIAGEFDKSASPGVMKKMAEVIPGSRYVQLAGVGHLQNLEAPDEFDAVVLDFLSVLRRLP